MISDLEAQILSRLSAEGHDDKPWAFAILAALGGAQELETYLDGNQTPKPSAKRGAGVASGPKPEPPGVYVSSITVAGFRGVGKSVTLPLTAGPGLTLIVGRNGSGKSSFAEGLECLLTGNNSRWRGRPKFWADGWRNLHESKQPTLEATLVVEGQGPLKVTRRWNSEKVEDSQAMVTAKGASSKPLGSFGWGDAMATFRPFLSYSELGKLLDDGPSKLFDALGAVLGLEVLGDVQATLADARKQREQQAKEAKQGAANLVTLLQGLPAGADDRVARALAALKPVQWDIHALQAVVAGGSVQGESVVAKLRAIAALVPPDLKAIGESIARLRSAERARLALSGTSAERSRERASLLEAALTFHQHHGGADCPVCGADQRLTPQWRASTEAQVAELKGEAQAVEAADRGCEEAVRAAKVHLSSAPAILAESQHIGLGTVAAARDAWTRWAAGRDLNAPGALADLLEGHATTLVDALTAVVEEAAAEIRKREDVWRPAADAIGEWLPLAKRALATSSQVAQLKAAETWWKDASVEIRNERFAPIESRAIEIWKALRLQSNVDLGGVELEGTATKRKVVLKVTVDGTDAEALGVMSQGELNALALSLFLPRATFADSPFRFISIDDPVQSMDPARVEGLARVLAETAKKRQVLVFTHDDRLPEAVRRLGIAANVLGVTRRENSVVEVRPVADPVFAYLDDARAVAKTQELPDDVVRRVVPGFCRSAVEAACMEKVRKRRLGLGESHQAVEDLLTSNRKTHPLMALALFDDAQRTSDVLAKLNKMGGWAADVFQTCKAGAHESYNGDVQDLISYTNRLAEQLRKIP